MALLIKKEHVQLLKAFGLFERFFANLYRNNPALFELEKNKTHYVDSKFYSLINSISFGATIIDPTITISNQLDTWYKVRNSLNHIEKSLEPIF